MLGEERQVIVRELVLQRFCGGGDDGRPSREDGGHEVGHRFSDAGPRLHHQLPATLEHLGGGLGHFELPCPGLAAAGQGGDHPLQRLRPAHEPDGTAWV